VHHAWRRALRLFALTKAAAKSVRWRGARPLSTETEDSRQARAALAAAAAAAAAATGG